MGEVYRARDTRLNRDVAIKVLPELFAADPDRLARFEREAQAIALQDAAAELRVHTRLVSRLHRHGFMNRRTKSR